MDIMIVAEENDVDARQRIPCHARIANPLRPRPTNRACAFRPDRVGQDVDAIDLDEEGCVIDEGDCDIVALKRLVQGRNALVLDSNRPSAAPFPKHHQDSQDAWRTPTRQSRIDEPLPVEMIGGKSAWTGHLATGSVDTAIAFVF